MELYQIWSNFQNTITFHFLSFLFFSKKFQLNFLKNIVNHPTIGFSFLGKKDIYQKIIKSSQINPNLQKVLSRKKENNSYKIFDFYFGEFYSSFIFNKKINPSYYKLCLSFLKFIKNFISKIYFLKFKKIKISKQLSMKKQKKETLISTKFKILKELPTSPVFFFKMNLFVFFLGKNEKNGKVFKVLNFYGSLGFEYIMKKKNIFYKKKRSFIDSKTKKKKCIKESAIFFGKNFIIFLKYQVLKNSKTNSFFSYFSQNMKKKNLICQFFLKINNYRKWVSLNVSLSKQLVFFTKFLNFKLTFYLIRFFKENNSPLTNFYTLKIPLVILFKILIVYKKFFRIKFLIKLFGVIYRRRVKGEISKNRKFSNFKNPIFLVHLSSLNIFTISNFLNMKTYIDINYEKNPKKITIECLDFTKTYSKAPFCFFLKKDFKRLFFVESFWFLSQSTVFQCKNCIFCFFEIFLKNFFFFSSKIELNFLVKCIKVSFFNSYIFCMSFKNIIYCLDFIILLKTTSKKCFFKIKIMKLLFGCIKKIFKYSEKEYLSFYIFLKDTFFSSEFYTFLFFIFDSSFSHIFFSKKGFSYDNFFFLKNPLSLGKIQTLKIRRHNMEISNFHSPKKKNKKAKFKKNFQFLIRFLEKNVNLGPNRDYNFFIPNSISFLVGKIQKPLFSKFLFFFLQKLLKGHFSRKIKINIIRFFQWKLINKSDHCILENFFYFYNDKSIISDKKFGHCFFSYFKNFQKILNLNTKKKLLYFIFYHIYFNQNLIYEKIFAFLELLYSKSRKKLNSHNIKKIILFLFKKTEIFFRTRKFKSKLKKLFFHSKIINLYNALSIYFCYRQSKKFFFMIISLYNIENQFLFLTFELIILFNWLAFKNNLYFIHFSSKKKISELVNKHLVFKRIFFLKSFSPIELKEKIFISWIKNIFFSEFKSTFLKLSSPNNNKKLKKNFFRIGDGSEIPFVSSQHLEIKTLKITNFVFLKKK
ncbi:hypothetical protein CMESO_373 (nucleomorph) [Chroomonas mesostigmatica CCMP1168]|uniref:Uncharacterized protein n=1 Tax=Chroomonas mesostigmatica CCMP1168 TaxID=1195612 RepID=J7G8D2_9CRYP|nr:hypothetical protein CMESO_373 [Chroomonas mesostigmatica CCMP1168]